MEPPMTVGSVALGSESSQLSEALEGPLLTRPGLQGGTTDKVTFGVILKQWHGIDFSQGTAGMDVVMTLQWKDPRAAAVLPDGAAKMRLPTETAMKTIWMPDMVISNRAYKGKIQYISSSVLVESNGQVTKVERDSVQLKEAFKIHNFPFDTQVVDLDLVSATYMDHEVELVPTSDQSLWGVSTKKIFENSAWSYEKSNITAFFDSDGLLKKSRGRTTFTVTRKPSQFIMTIGLPSVVLLFMTWTAFWLPLHGPYVMPRVAINAFGLLCQLNVSNTAAKTVPMNGKDSIMTEYLSLCIQLQFTVMMLNVLLLALENCKYGVRFNGDVNNMVTMTFPITTFVNIVVLWCGRFVLSNALCYLTMIAYFVHLYREYQFYKDGDLTPRSGASPPASPRKAEPPQAASEKAPEAAAAPAPKEEADKKEGEKKEETAPASGEPAAAADAPAAEAPPAAEGAGK
jgi:hypothetical protein